MYGKAVAQRSSRLSCKLEDAGSNPASLAPYHEDGTEIGARWRHHLGLRSSLRTPTLTRA